MRLKDLEKFAFSLFFLNHSKINAEIGPAIAEAMLGCDWGNVKSGLSFVYLTTTLAKLGCQVEGSMDTVLTAANACTMEHLDTDKGLATAIQFLFDLNIPFVQKVVSFEHQSQYYSDSRSTTNTSFPSYGTTGLVARTRFCSCWTWRVSGDWSPGPGCVPSAQS